MLQKGLRIKFTTEGKVNGVGVKSGDVFELFLPSTKPINNHLFVRVGKKGKMLSPYPHQNTIPVLPSQMERLAEKYEIV